jgi:hypothetical protein
VSRAAPSTGFGTYRAHLHALSICCAPHQAHIGWQLQAHLDVTIGRLQDNTSTSQACHRVNNTCMCLLLSRPDGCLNTHKVEDICVAVHMCAPALCLNTPTCVQHGNPWSHLQLHHQPLVEECRLIQKLQEGCCCLGHDRGCIRPSLQHSTAQHSTTQQSISTRDLATADGDVCMPCTATTMLCRGHTTQVFRTKLNLDGQQLLRLGTTYCCGHVYVCM